MFRVGIRGKKSLNATTGILAATLILLGKTFRCLLSRPLLKYFHYCCPLGGEHFRCFEGELALPSPSTDSSKCRFFPDLLVLPHTWPCPSFWTQRTNDNRATLRGLEADKTSSQFNLQTLAVRVVEGLSPQQAMLLGCYARW